MKKSNQQFDDQQLLDHLSKKVGPQAYHEHMRIKSAGMQVDVVESAMNAKPSTSKFAIAGVIASIATILLVVFSPFSNVQNSDVAQPVAEVAAISDPSDEMASAYLEEMISEQTIESLFETTSNLGQKTTTSTSTLLTESDIDALLAEL